MIENYNYKKTGEIKMDIESKNNDDKGWFYTSTVKEHFMKPKGIVKSDEAIKEFNADGVGQVGSPACGDVMKMWLKIDKENDKIIDCLWQTFGCASAIASTSMLSVILTREGGMKIDQALALKPKDILDELGGLPPRKVHCSVLGDQALRSAIYDYFKKSGQEERIVKK